MKKYLLGLTLSLALFGFAKAASAATLILSPSTQTFTADQTYNVDILLNTSGASIDGVDIYFLHYNSNILQVQDANASASGIQISAGTLLSQTLTNTVNATTGTITFSQVATGGTTYTGSGTLATIAFKAIANGTSAVTFDFTSGSTSDTNVAGQGTDKLTSVTNGSYTVTGGTNPQPPPPPPPGPVPFPPPPPPGPTPSPTPSPTPVPVRPDMYPPGTIYKYAGNATVYILGQNNTASPITDWTVYLNQVPATRSIITIPSSIQFTLGSVLGLRSGTLIKASNNATVYLVVSGKKLAFSTEQEFHDHNYNFSNVYSIDDVNLVNSMATSTDAFERPIGTLFKYANSPAVYFLNGSRTKRGYTTIQMFNIWNATLKDVVTIPASETYPDGPIATLPNGIAVKGSGSTIYFVYNDQLRPFTDMNLLTSMGLTMAQVKTFPDSDIAFHTIGSPMQ